MGSSIVQQRDDIPFVYSLTHLGSSLVLIKLSSFPVLRWKRMLPPSHSLLHTYCTCTLILSLPSCCYLGHSHLLHTVALPFSPTQALRYCGRLCSLLHNQFLPLSWIDLTKWPIKCLHKCELWELMPQGKTFNVVEIITWGQSFLVPEGGLGIRHWGQRPHQATKDLV